MIIDRVSREREANRLLFRIVHHVAIHHAGRPFDEIVGVLRRELPGSPPLAEEEIRRIAEQISVGRDPSGLPSPE
ncbi:hypothetical protein GCM10009555_016170 [Acrocarpospora macrocephala]|uniref:Uncharacterized protein n=1 Tax=Acrocarpospora macrocephala TaxID=150177 RepID=A0A5M3XAB7_9ACTN|nr:hypothetical protein [Acrocarpospora macrocephala]GES15783.1 hypothetical protein Amac_093810 [Acrocarpospora macrocephala]